MPITPTITEEQQEVACSMATEGKLIKNIRAHLGYDSNQWYKIMAAYPLFAQKLNHARIIGYTEIAESVLGIPEEYCDPQQGRVALECKKVFLGWMDPAKYGNRIDLHVTQTLDITAALESSRRRLERSVEPITLIASDSDELW